LEPPENPARFKLVRRIQAEGPTPPKIRVATRIGFHGSEFAFPDEVIAAGTSKLGICLDPSSTLYAGKFRASREKGWTEIPRLAKGNSRFMTCLALGFVGPCVIVMDLEQVGLQLAGPPESGKSSIAIATGSIWGRHIDPNRAREHGFIETWNNTALKFEQVALGHNHTLLIADETRTASKDKGSVAATILDVAMRLEKASEKGRQPDLMASRSWWVPFLSTSNETLDALCRAEGILLDDAYRGRLIDIGAPVGGIGFFEDLHGYTDVAAFSARLKELAASCFGWPSRQFIRKLVRWYAKDRKALRSWFGKRRQWYLKHAERISAPGRQLNRIHQKFATIYAAGCLARKFGILPWSRKELRDALLKCERDHIELVAKEISAPVKAKAEPLAKLLDHIREHRHQFVDLGSTSEDRKRGDPQFGYLNRHNGNPEFLFTEKVFDTIAGGKKVATELKKELDQRGLIVTTGAGKQGTRYVVRRRLAADRKAQRQSVVAVSAAILDVGLDAKKSPELASE
jgi:putative DNA primase/helicase